MLELVLFLVHFRIERGHFLGQEAKLKAARIHIYVRRGGPNYEKGLAKMRMLGEEIGIPIEVNILFTEMLVTFMYNDDCDDSFKMSASIRGERTVKSLLEGPGVWLGVTKMYL